MSADLELLRRIQKTCQMIVDDMEADNDRWDGQPWTGRTTAEQFGELRATVSALATMVGHLAKGVS